MWGSPDTYLAIILTVVLTTALAWWRESKARDRSEAREDRLRKQAEDRDDRLRQEAQAREDRLRREAEERDNALRQESQARQDHLAETERTEWVYQQWWGRKFDAYDEVLRALWQRFDYASRQRNALIERRLNPRAQAAPKPFDNQANVETLTRTMALGAFLFAPEVEKALRDYKQTVTTLTAQHDSTEPLKTWSADIAAIEKTIHAVRYAALKDLRLEEFRPVEVRRNQPLKVMVPDRPVWIPGKSEENATHGDQGPV